MRLPTSVREAGVRSTAQIGRLTAIPDAFAHLGGLVAPLFAGLAQGAHALARRVPCPGRWSTAEGRWCAPFSAWSRTLLPPWGGWPRCRRSRAWWRPS
ncbi:MAG: hypothetical protein E2582_23780 [Delftia sp.]|nr:hypothetical protein [Delftia sp.]MPT54255.1 hypothetical protein [Delftia sp.]